MSALSIVQLVIALLNGVYSTVSKNPDPLAQVIATSINNAIANLNLVHNTEVTKAQLDGYKVTPTW